MEQRGNEDCQQYHQPRMPLVGTRRDQQRKRVQMCAFRPKNMKVDRSDYMTNDGFGREYTVDVFVADEAPRSRSTVICMCWVMMANVSEKHTAVALYASALGAFVPRFLHVILPILQKRNVEINIIDIPDASEDLDFGTDVHRMFFYDECLLNFALCLMIPFKNLDDKNFSNFINARKKELGGKLGMNARDLTKYKFPLNLERAHLIQSILSSSTMIKREIIKYLMFSSECDGAIQAVARYVSSIIAWNEMNNLVFIANVFISSKSPVLTHPAIQDEVSSYHRAMVHVLGSNCPQYFMYFCDGAEEQMISRQNFSVLASAAQELTRRKQKGKSIENFAGTVERGSELVEELIRIHEDFCKTPYTDRTARNLKFLFDEDDYQELLEDERGPLQ